jgi:hypothetical protein
MGLLIAIGTAWGAIVARCLFGAFEQIEHHPNPRLTIIGSLITLTGTAAVLVYVLPPRGLLVGLTTALSTTVILGAALPAMALVGEWLSGPHEDGTGEVASQDPDR